MNLHAKNLEHYGFTRDGRDSCRLNVWSVREALMTVLI